MSAAREFIRGTARALDVSGSIPYGDVAVASVDWTEDPVGALELRRRIPRGSLDVHEVVSRVMDEVRAYDHDELLTARELLRNKVLSATLLGALLGVIVGLFLRSELAEDDE